MDLTICVDGACNRWGRMGTGYVVRNTNTQEILDRGHRSITGRGTNNVSEYTAILVACGVAKKMNAASVIIYTDSQLVLRQLKGEYAVRNVRLRKLHRLLVIELKSLKATVRWHSREEGDGPLADKLASYRYKEVLNARNDSEVQQAGAGAHAGNVAAQSARIEAR